MAAALAIGFMFGIIVELMFDTTTIRELQTRNHKLRLENETLRKEAKHEVIEIVDNRTKDNEIKFGGF
jgi:regulator of replication initiation timing